jgi:hypothetical protein
MTDQESVRKNAVCDLLMEEGIDGWSDEDNVARTCLLTDLGVELGRKDSLACVLVWYEALEKKDIRGEQAILLDYSRANAIAGERYGTAWRWEQPTLARAVLSSPCRLAREVRSDSRRPQVHVPQQSWQAAGYCRQGH